jgi:hypothetical protein
MNKIIVAGALAAILGAGSVAYAGQGIPNLPAQPIVAQTDAGVMGQSDPNFTGTAQPVVSLQFAANATGQAYPAFAPAPGTRAGSSSVEYATVAPVIKPRG